MLSLALVGIGFAEPCHAQSYDCGAARSPIEKRICSDPDLSAFDYELSRVFRTALKDAGADHGALLAQQREWLKNRDAECQAPAPETTRDARKTLACIRQAYENRLAELAKRLPVDEPARKAPCEALVKAYEQKLAMDPQSAYRVSKSGVTSAKYPSQLVLVEPKEQATFTPDDVSQHVVEKFFNRQNGGRPQVQIHGLQQLADALPFPIALDHLPNTNVYALSQIGGTAYCYQFYHVFRIENDAAVYISRPDGWERTEADACMVSRRFGTLMGNPVAFETSLGPGLKETIKMSPWVGDHFAAVCRTEFAYAPVLDINATTDDGDADEHYSDCKDDKICQNLNSKSVALIEPIVRGPADALADARASLDEVQRRQFSEWMEGHEIKPSTSNDWWDFDRNDPFVAPLLLDGSLFVAKFSHPYIRDIIQTAWDISVDPVGSGSSYRFYMGMDFGRFLGAKVD